MKRYIISSSTQQYVIVAYDGTTRLGYFERFIGSRGFDCSMVVEDVDQAKLYSDIVKAKKACSYYNRYSSRLIVKDAEYDTVAEYGPVSDSNPTAQQLQRLKLMQDAGQDTSGLEYFIKPIKDCYLQVESLDS